jgi:hypothetical protein
MPIVSMGLLHVFLRDIVSSPEIFVNHSKLVVRLIGALGRIHFTAHTLKHCI